MANEFNGTDEEWARWEAPLLKVEPILAAFAQSNGMYFSKNIKDWPERSLCWGSNIRRLIQLYLVEPKELTFNLWLCASQDRNLSRFWKKEFLIEKKPIEEFSEQLPALLAEAAAKLNSWDEKQLEFVTKIGGII